ncbi:hypothetical protein ACVB8X_20940 [Streptomyces sp. NRAIS4]
MIRPRSSRTTGCPVPAPCVHGRAIGGAGCPPGAAAYGALGPERAARVDGPHPAQAAVGDAGRRRRGAARGDDREDAVPEGAQDTGAALRVQPLVGAGQRTVLPASRDLRRR